MEIKNAYERADSAKNREKRREDKKYGVKRIGVFGSYERGEPKERSDIDILVEFKKGKITFDNYRLILNPLYC